MTPRTCPVNGCGLTLGTTRNGNPYLMCPRHYSRLSQTNQLLLWRAYGSWQRIERKYLANRTPALLEARALAISHYIDVRDDCLRQVAEGEPQQQEMEVAL